MQKIPDNIDFLQNYAPYLINRVANKWNSEFNKMLKSKKIVNLSQWRVMAVIHARPNLSLTELIGLVIMDQPTVSRIVDSLVELDLVRRTLQADDRRYLSLSLTPKGTEIVNTLWPMAREFYGRATSDLTEAEVDTLIQILRKAADAPSLGY